MSDNKHSQDISSEEALAASQAEDTAQEQPETDPLEEIQAELARSKDQTLRLAAELENLKKRSARAETDAKRYAVTRFAEDMVGVSDNLYRALDAIPAEAQEAATDLLQQLVEGVQMTQDSLQGAFGRHGIQQLDPKGERFNPACHQAVAQIPSSDVPQGNVVEVIQKGYVLGDRTLRAAIVAVSSGAPAPVNAEPAKAEPEVKPGSTIDTQA